MANSIVAETVDVIHDFAKDPDISQWIPVEPGTIAYEDGALRLAMPKYVGGPHQWPRAERNLTAWDVSKYNGIEVTVRNATDHTQRMDLLMGDRSENSYFMQDVPPGEFHTYRLRFEDGYNHVDWSDIHSLRIMRTTPDADYVWNIRRVALFTDDPATTPRGKVEALLAKTDELYQKSLPHLDDARRATIQKELQQWRDVLNTAGALRGKYRSVQVELASLRAVISRAKAEQQAKEQADPAMLAWSVVPGQTFRPTEAMLQYQEPLQRLTVQAAHGEYGEAIVRLTNMSEQPQDLKVRINPPEGTTLPGLTLRRNIPIMARDNTLTGDALAPLDPSAVVTVPAGETVELWVRADVRHADWPNGTHAFTLDVRDLRRAGAPVTTVPVDVVVLNVDLNQADRMHVQMWPEISHPRSWIVHGREELARDNLFDYGADIISFLRSETPQPVFGDDGSLESIDFTAHDKTVDFYMEAGKPLLLYWMEMDVGKEDFYWELREGFEPGSDVWNTALANWLRAWKQHMDEKGMGPEQYAFYVTDEPDREELQRTYLFAKVAKAVDPSLRIYVNGSHDLWGDEARDAAFMDVVDIWQPDENHFTPALRELLDSRPHIERWVYQCKMSRRSYDVNMHDYYRLMAWRMLRDGGNGIGYWTYSATHPGEDPWDETAGEAAGGILVYPDTDNGLIMSARWELIRMSLDDARYADLLRKATPATDDQRKQIEALLGPRIAEAAGAIDQPELVAKWRIEAGQLLNDLAE